MRFVWLTSLLALGCHEVPLSSRPPRLPTVHVATVAKKKVESRLPLSGVLTPLPGRDVKVGSLVTGRVDAVFVAEGQKVRAGEPLAHVEAAPLQDRVTESEAQKAQAQATLENARGRLDRTERLFKDGIAARQEVDDYRAALVAAESALAQASAVRATAHTQLGRATLRAPIDGVVAAILVPAGQPVDGNATPVVEVADTHVLNLRAPVPASRIGEIWVGQSAELSVEGAGKIAGIVEAIAPLVDTTNNTVLVRIRVDNRNGNLRGGQFARGAVIGLVHDGIALPRSALLPTEGGLSSTVALVRNDNTVALRRIDLGADLDGEIEVRGLNPGERVIVAGGYALPAGIRVEIAQ